MKPVSESLAAARSLTVTTQCTVSSDPCFPSLIHVVNETIIIHCSLQDVPL